LSDSCNEKPRAINQLALLGGASSAPAASTTNARLATPLAPSLLKIPERKVSDDRMILPGNLNGH